ncbi:MAG: IS1634 family transposase [Bryobacterales bacterium]|nr:IS1634 family transposase [Bryobacterales bacterium]
MASLIKKRKGNQNYYYVAVSARVNGKPRIVSQTYLGTAERLAKLVRQKAAPVPLEATALDLGLPGALWLAARDSGAFDALLSVWPAPRKGPAIAHYLLLAAIHRICSPGPKTTVPAWYQGTCLRRLWGFPSQRFSSQAFWNRFDTIDTDPSPELAEHDDLERAQTALLQAFRSNDLVGERVLSYDTTNFPTWIASSNERCRLAQRGHSKQKCHDLRQIGLSYALDAQHGLSLCHHVYPGNVSDSGELPAVLPGITRMLDRAGVARDTVTLVMDKGSAALANSLELQRHGLHWVAALPWNQAPQRLRMRPVEELESLEPRQPGVKACAHKEIVHGAERLCVLSHSASFAVEQLHSTTASMAKAAKGLRRLSRDLDKPGRKFREAALRKRIGRLLAPNRVSRVLPWELSRSERGFELSFEVDHAALDRLLRERFGRTVLVTSRTGWSAGQVVDAYARQQQVEQVFRGLKGGNWAGWGPMHHWTDSKIKVHAFYCMLAVSLWQHVRCKAERVWPGLSVEQLQEQLAGIQQIELLYPRQGEKGPGRTVTVATKRSVAQEALTQALGLTELLPTRKP